jgi:hypothetical protein
MMERMKFLPVLIVTLATVTAGCGCKEPPPNRSDSPEAAINAARRALHTKDMAAFIDTLTETYVRVLMENSIAECIYQNIPAVAARTSPWKGCEDILARYGWPNNLGRTPQAFKLAADQIRDPRGLVVALAYNRGTTFARDYFDHVTVTGLVVSGKTARGTATWKSGGVGPIIFEKDATGWRVHPSPVPQ